MTKQHSMIAYGVMKIVPFIPTRVVVGKLKESPIWLRKGSVVGLALLAPTKMTQLRYTKYYAMRISITTVPMDQTTDTFEEERPVPWQKTLQAGQDLKVHHYLIVAILSIFEEMWSDWLNQVGLANHCSMVPLTLVQKHLKGRFKRNVETHSEKLPQALPSPIGAEPQLLVGASV